MAVGLVTVPRVLREKLGDDGADALVEFLNSAQVVQKSGLDLFAERLERRLDALSREFDGKLDAKLDLLRRDSEDKYGKLDAKLDVLRRDFDGKLDGLRNFVLVVVGVGVAFLSLVVVLVQWLGK